VSVRHLHRDFLEENVLLLGELWALKPPPERHRRAHDDRQLLHEGREALEDVMGIPTNLASGPSHGG